MQQELGPPQTTETSKACRHCSQRAIELYVANKTPCCVGPVGARGSPKGDISHILYGQHNATDVLFAHDVVAQCGLDNRCVCVR